MKEVTRCLMGGAKKNNHIGVGRPKSGITDSVCLTTSTKIDVRNHKPDERRCVQTLMGIEVRRDKVLKLNPLMRICQPSMGRRTDRIVPKRFERRLKLFLKTRGIKK
jgi:hypothetical protein